MMLICGFRSSSIWPSGLLVIFSLSLTSDLSKEIDVPCVLTPKLCLLKTEKVAIDAAVEFGRNLVSKLKIQPECVN